MGVAEGLGVDSNSIIHYLAIAACLVTLLSELSVVIWFLVNFIQTRKTKRFLILVTVDAVGQVLFCSVHAFDHGWSLLDPSWQQREELVCRIFGVICLFGYYTGACMAIGFSIDLFIIFFLHSHPKKKFPLWFGFSLYGVAVIAILLAAFLTAAVGPTAQSHPKWCLVRDGFPALSYVTIPGLIFVFGMFIFYFIIHLKTTSLINDQWIPETSKNIYRIVFRRTGAYPIIWLFGCIPYCAFTIWQLIKRTPPPTAFLSVVVIFANSLGTANAVSFYFWQHIYKRDTPNRSRRELPAFS